MGKRATTWHCTPVANLEKIQRDGLVPTNDSPIHLSEEYPLVGFVGDLYDCEEIAVFEVDIMGLPTFEDGEGPNCYITIPPEHLRFDGITKRSDQPNGRW